MKSSVSNPLSDLKDLRETVPHCHNSGNSVEGATLMTEDDRRLWALIKERKRFWLLPGLIVAVIIGILAVWSPVPAPPPSGFFIAERLE